MPSSMTKSVLMLSVGFLAGAVFSRLYPAEASASQAASPSDPSSLEFMVSVDEVQQNFVFAETFTGTYQRDVVMSDGSVRSIELTPMIHEGKAVVEFKDNGGRTYMGLNGTTTNGRLMVQVRDVAASIESSKSQGW